ncbi:MAG: tRNA (adenosine(37)-N6)-dimethylallyltransferase MiaA [Anaeroplasma sp.]
MKKVIVVVGPTAVGKSKLAIKIAKYYGLSIVSGDSVSVFKRLNIGSAKPSDDEMKEVKHYLIDIKEPYESYSVADFQRDARQIIDNNDKVSLICGGTGLYIQSVLYNYEFEADRRNLDYNKKYEGYSNGELYDLLLSKDSSINQEKLHPNNRKRVLRALEVLEQTNKSIHSYDKKNEKVYDYFIIYLSMAREKLYDRINQRVELMFEQGLEQEVKELYDEGIYPHAIGYQELIPYFNGLISIEAAKEEIKKNTRHLAKRQETWFKNQMDCNFYDIDTKKEDELFNIIISDIDRWMNL